MSTKTVPNAIKGLLANDTKFFDTIEYLNMEQARRPKSVTIVLEPLEKGSVKVPTYDDRSKLCQNLLQR